MIKATELRTGNYVQHKSETVKVKSLSSAAVNGHPENEFEPIPLMPDYLEHAGFDRGADASGRPSGPYKKGPCEVIVRNEYYAPEYVQPNGTALPNLHQLQNLYFALTGEELNVKA